MAATDAFSSLNDLNDGLLKLQKSARRTIPVFLLGILATLIAAGVALYYILTLSADLREARGALQQSQSALLEARTNLSDVQQALSEARQTAGSLAEATTIAAAISDVSRSQASINTASSSIKTAAAKLPSTTPPRRQRASQPAPDSPGTFQVVETGDGFLVLRAQPSMVSAEVVKVPDGGVLQCSKAIRNEANNWWRPCTDAEGRSGFVSNKFIRRL